MFIKRSILLVALVSVQQVLATSLATKLALKVLPMPEFNQELVAHHNHEKKEEMKPAPGAIASTLKVSSVQNILRLAFPLVSNEVFQNKTFVTDVDTSILGTSIKISEIHTNDVTGFSLIEFQFIEGTDDIHLLVQNINIDMDIQSEIKFTVLPKAKISNVKVSGLDVVANISSNALSDGVRWELGLDSHFQIKDLDITFKPFYIQKMYNANKQTIVKAINWVLGEFFPEFISAYVDMLNWKVHNEKTGETFMTSGAHPMNMMMTQAPKLDHTTDLIELHFDGLFYDEAARQFEAEVNTEWQPRQEVKQLEQIHIHQSLFNSFVYAKQHNDGPHMFEDESLAKQVKESLPEVQKKWGEDAVVTFGLILEEFHTKEAIKFDIDKSIVLGSPDKGDLKATIQIYVAEAGSTETHLGAQIKTDFYAIYNATFANFALTQQIEEAKTSNGVVTNDKIGIMSEITDINVWMNKMLIKRTSEFNLKYIEGLDITEKIPVVAFVNGLVKQTLMTPHVENGNLFGGFRWLSDM